MHLRFALRCIFLKVHVYFNKNKFYKYATLYRLIHFGRETLIEVIVANFFSCAMPPITISRHLCPNLQKK